QGSQKRSNSTPETPRPKRAPSSRSPYGLFSPGSFSPRWVRGPGGLPLSHSSRNWLLFLPTLFSFFYSFLSLKILLLELRWSAWEELSPPALAARVEELGEVLRRHHGLDGFASAALPAQEPVTVLGQISCDGNGKLNAKSVLLVGDREHSGGAQVPLDLSELPEYSLFPGQVVALEGTNSTGGRMVVSKLYEV
ncbi:DPOA2 polymerase, partial [Dryoscopus gambensis]|nr:DPOA2 polymerase [Dryoscopus gambensis]